MSLLIKHGLGDITPKSATVIESEGITSLKQIDIHSAEGAKTVWKSGAVVTYYVDTGVSYIEEVDSGDSVLSPTTFTPEKSGYTFVGWREDNKADSAVLSDKTMGSDPITLYAVFKKDIVLSYYEGEKITGSKTSPLYYNNSDVTKASFSVVQKDLSGWTERGWGVNSAADATKVYDSSATIELDSNLTIYGLYSASVTCNFYSGTNKSTNNPVTATRYYNSAGNTKEGSAKAPTPASISGWTFRGYGGHDQTAADAYVGYQVGDTVPNISSTENHYATYQRTFTITYNGNGASSGSTSSTSDTAYYNSANNYKYPTVTLGSNGFTHGNVDYYFNGWNIGSAGASYTLKDNVTAYAQWVRYEASPFYIYSQNPTYSREAVNGTIGGYDPTSSNPYWYVQITHNGGVAASYGNSTSSPFDRRHCTKCKVTAHIVDRPGEDRIMMGGRSYYLSVGENIFDISDLPGTIQIALYAGSGGANHGVQVTAPYFY